MENRHVYLGMFVDKDSAVAARVAAEQKYGFRSAQ